MKGNSICGLMMSALLAVVAGPALGQVSLGTSQNFAVLGGSTVTNTGVSSISGELGVSPGTAVIGFPPGIVTNGSIHTNDAVAMQAQTDLTTAYNAVAGTPCNVDLSGQDLGGLTLTPGVYCFSTSAQLTGTLRLDFQGNPNAVFLFQIGSTLTTASGSSVLLLNSGGSTCPANLFFQVGSSATLGTGSSFVGNILALSSITLTSGASLSGRALARNGAVTLDTNSVARCGPATGCPLITVNPATLPTGVIGTAYNQTVTASGGAAPYTFSVTSGALPTGLVLNPATGAITGVPTVAGTFNFTITATDANGCQGIRAYVIGIASTVGCPVLALSPTALPPGAIGTPYNQTIAASGGMAPYTYLITSGALPPGLAFNGANGAITGTPIAPGIFTFTVRATDANGCQASRTYTIVIGAVGGAPTGIPTLGLTGLTALMLLLAGIGLFAMRKHTA